MTRSHRRNHLAAWLVLSPLIIGVLVAAFTIRAEAKAQLAQPPTPPLPPAGGSVHP